MRHISIVAVPILLGVMLFGCNQDSQYKKGYAQGAKDAYERGLAEGLTEGNYTGFTLGYELAYDEGQIDGMQIGYVAGYTDGSSGKESKVKLQTLTSTLKSYIDVKTITNIVMLANLIVALAMYCIFTFVINKKVNVIISKILFSMIISYIWLRLIQPSFMELHLFTFITDQSQNIKLFIELILFFSSMSICHLTNFLFKKNIVNLLWVGVISSATMIFIFLTYTHIFLNFRSTIMPATGELDVLYLSSAFSLGILAYIAFLLLKNKYLK